MLADKLVNSERNGTRRNQMELLLDVGRLANPERNGTETEIKRDKHHLAFSEKKCVEKCVRIDFKLKLIGNLNPEL